MSHHRVLLLIAKQVGRFLKKNDDDDQADGHLILEENEKRGD
jgi:hypothetical protein